MSVIDFWEQEDFEDTVASGLVSMYESKIRKNKGAGPNTLKEKDLAFFRKNGAYVAGNSRLIHMRDSGVQIFDIKNDGIPQSGCFGFKGNAEEKGFQYNGYFSAFCFKKIKKLPPRWVRSHGGYMYQLVYINATNKNGIEGEKRYLSMTKDGEIYICDELVPHQLGNGKNTIISHNEADPKRIDETQAWANASMQFMSDSRYCWSIMAEEGIAKITLGSMKEEIKSLLYARTLPMTETGRKRPVLHLVESHKRRMKNGTDIDITSYLRGTQKIEIGGTLFTVKPPVIKKPELSKNSMRYYDS